MTRTESNDRPTETDDGSTDGDDLRAIDPEDASPEDVDVERVRAGLESDENLVRTHAAQLTTALAAEDPAAVEPLVSTLGGMFDDERSVVLKEVLFTLSLLAEEHPEAVVDHLGGVIDCLGHEVPLVRTAAARVVRPTVVARPAVFGDHVEALLAVVERPIDDPVSGYEPSANERMVRAETIQNVRQQAERRQQAARTVAAHVLVEVADADADAVVDHVDRLVDLLDADGPVVRAASAGALANVAEHHPSAVEPAVDPLIEALDDADTPTRARAVAALGYVGDDSAVEPLRRLAASEGDDDLRDLAAETADFLADR